MRKPLLFMHIHKTAGQSFTQYLKQQFKPEKICPHNVDCAILATPAKELSQYEFFSGHISMKALSEKIPDFDVITILRNPRNRIISAYHYWKSLAARNEPNIPAVFYDILNMSFADFLTNSKTKACVDNVQARLLSGGYYGDSNQHRTMVYGDSLKPLWDRFLHIGLTENLSASIQKVAEHYGWKQAQAATINTNAYQHIITDEEEKLLENVTWFDWQAYQHIA
jgi:hypothetical protein